MNTATENSIPAGYIKNSKGHLVQEQLLSPYDVEMNDFVIKHINRAYELQQQIAKLKQEVYEDCYAFKELLEEKYSAKKGGKKGGMSFTSFDGELQIRISVQDRITMGPELRIAEQLIKECAQEWAKTSSAEVRAIIFNTFETDKEGNLSIAKVLSFKREYQHVSEDPRWVNGMEAITDAIKVVGSKSYLNFKKRNPEGKFLNIPLDISKL
ncbi:DUF3164 family protein [Motilimonas cestriensis]|uniref:DUF3164 family protein n=1 Tax=Motilimonas cestriensis TaxID=2742685 RepID=A0ABS8W837_9GAMM|nr:DUF3164 family protein [Motilimonas cestriensis]MCE2594435.1 DUF3164 family protein [Motilimonas cestriensis]